jgi:hypothetical protein
MTIDVPQLILVTASHQTTKRFEALLIDEVESSTFTCVPNLQEAATITFAGQRAIIFWEIPAALAEDPVQQTQMGQVAQHGPLILLASNQLEPLAQSLSQELAHDYLLLDELSASLLRRSMRHASRLFAAQQTDCLATTTTVLTENISNFTALWQSAPDAMVFV